MGLLKDKFDLEATLLCVLLIIMTIVCSMQVIWRYVLKSSLSWSEELARYLFVWMVWLGAAYAAKKMRHIRIEFLKTTMPARWQPVFDLIAFVVTIVFSGILAFVAFGLTRTIAYRQQVTPAMQIPMWIPYAAVPVGVFLMGLRTLQNLVALCKRWR